MLGVGGSLIMIPALTELLGPDQHLYQSAAMIVNFFVVVPAVIQHRREKAIELTNVMRLIPLAVAAVIVGVMISELHVFSGEGEAYLRGLFGLFLLAVCLSDLYRLCMRKKISTETTSKSNKSRVGWIHASLVAIPTGLVAGLLGVGGGILAVPLQHKLLKVPMRNAIANSATLIIATSVVGAYLKNSAYYAQHDYSLKSFMLAACLIPTAILGSMLGSRLTHRLPLRFVKTAFFILLSIAAVRLTYRALQSSPIPHIPTQINDLPVRTD